MWIAVIGAVIIIIVFSTILIFSSSNTNKSLNKEDKKVYAMPKQRRYPWFYIKDCGFFADGSSRFAYSEDELLKLISNQEENIKKEDFGKAIRISNEIIKAAPKIEKVWLNKINSVFQDVIQKEKAWDENYSKLILNACFGFLQCSETVLERSLSVKHTLIPTLLKNINALVKYQVQNVTKYHNFEVYNMIINIYYVLPYKELLNLLSNFILEDKFDKNLENEEYARMNINSFLSHVDMLRTRNTSRLQETFESKKITNCTLISDEKINASIVVFDLTYEVGGTKEKVEASFFDEKGEEIFFGKDDKMRFIDTFETNTQRGATVKEEIVVLTEKFINKVRLKIYEESLTKKDILGYSAIPIKPKEELGKDNKSEESLNVRSKEEREVHPSKEHEVEESLVKDEEEKDNSEEEALLPNKPQMLMYPSFENIKDIKFNDYQLVCLKDDGTVIVIGDHSDRKQTSTWEAIEKIYVGKDAVYAIKSDNTVIYDGDCEYENPEYIYAWENVESLVLGNKHMLALTKNNTVLAIGNNENGQCNTDEWYDIIQVEASFHSVGLVKDGTVRAVGENNFGECDVGSWKDIVQIAVGDFYTVGLTSLGKVLATGLNSCGQCNVSEWANIKKIFACGNMTVGLRYDGHIVISGKNSYRFDDAKQWSRIKDSLVIKSRVFAIEQDGTLFATGKPYRDFVSGSWQSVIKVAANSEHIIALKEDGKLLCNGLVFGHVLSSNIDNILQICENTEANKIAMLTDRGVFTVTNKRQSVIADENYPVLYNIKKADMSSTHAVMLKNDGKAAYIRFCDRAVIDLQEWDSIVDVKAGEEFIIGLNIGGKVLISGDMEKGQGQVSSWEDIVKIDASRSRIIGLTIDGKLRLAGTNEFGEGDFLKTLENVKDFAVTELQTMALMTDGTVKASYHPLGINIEGIKDWKSIKKVIARGNDFLGLKLDGKILSTLENEVEISKWENVDDIFASGTFTWAILKETENVSAEPVEEKAVESE